MTFFLQLRRENCRLSNDLAHLTTKLEEELAIHITLLSASSREKQALEQKINELQALLKRKDPDLREMHQSIQARYVQ